MIRNMRLVFAAIALLCLCVPAEVFCEPAGDLQVTLLPAGAISAGAMWRVVGETTWHASGESVVYGIDSTWPGPTIEFKPIVGWRSPQTRTIALAEDGTVSTVATYYPLSVIADSQADFSLTQGNKGWRYGYYSSGTTFTQFTQTQYNATFGNLWYGSNGYLWNAGGHPYDNAHKTVRRWVSSVDGHVLILGHMWRFPGANGGNGFTGSVSVNGVTQYSQAIGGSDNIGVNYSFDAQVTTGSFVDFMIDANGDITLDNSGLTGIIATSTSTGSLKATIIPSEAAAAGAKWRRAGTAQWFASGETEYDIPVGNYNVEFSALAGWTTPTSQSVAIASEGQLCQVNATYTAGSMQVMIQPESAVTAGAQWRRVGTTTWLASGTIESGIPTGNHSVEFAPLAGWRSPQARILTVASEATASTVATYYPSTVVIADSVADFSLTQGYKDWFYGWRPNGTSGFTQFTTTGTDSNGHYWTGGGGSWSLLWASYGHPEVSNETVRRWISSVTGPATISGNMWKRVGQNWGNGFVGSVNIAGSQQYTKTIAYNDNTGVPFSFGATLVSGTAVDFVINGNGNITSDHAGFTGVIKVPVSTGSLLVTIQPVEAVAAGAKWRRVGTSTWFGSGETDYDVPTGNYSIEFSDLIGWTAPASKAVTIADSHLCQATGIYPTGSMHVTIQPALAITHGAQWRRVGATTWLNSGDSECVPLGSYDIEFKKIKCWHEPLTVTADVTVGNSTEVTRTYRGGSVVAWGANTSGQCNVPAPNADFVAVAAGFLSSIGLRSDGTVATWGTDPNIPSTLPSPNSDFVAVGAGYGYYLGLKSDGSVAAWGLNDQGQCNVPDPNSGFVAIAGGEGGYAIGLKNDGTVVGWGDNYSGAATTQYLGAGVQAIATGIGHSLALLPNGSIVGWGYNDVGQLNVPAPNSDFVSIACGNFCSIGVKSNGTIAVWGANDFGQVSPLPSPNSGFVAASGNLSVVGLKSDGSVIEWGSRVGFPSPNTGFVAVAAGQDHSLALRIPDFGHLRVTVQPAAAVANGARWRRVGTTQWFSSGETEYDVPAESCSIELCDIDGWATPAAQVVTIQANQTNEVICKYLTWSSLRVNISPDLAVTHKGQWRQVGTTTWLNSGDSIVVPEGDCSVEFKKVPGWCTPMTRTVRVAPDNTTQTTGTYHGGALVAWGDNTNYNLLTLPSPNSEFVAVDGGYFFGAGLKSSGSIVAWGIAYGTRIPSPNSGFMAISCDGERALALRTNGTVASWPGDSVPSPNSGFVAIDTGEDEYIGLKFDGSVAVWGGNSFRQMTDVPNPNSGFTAVAAGGFHCLALKTNGSVKAWGRNADGQSNPPPYYDFIAVSGARYNSLGLKANGMIVGWGYDYYGLNATLYPPVGSTYVSVSSSGYHAMALTDTGSITAWGMDYAGSNTVPTPNSGFLAIGAAFSTNFAIRSVDIGALRVTTTPAEGKWRRVGTSTWYASGETEYDVVAGSYSIEFSDLAGWTKPSPIPVTTTTQITQLTATYIAMTLHQAKNCADGTVVSIGGITISAAWPDVFYIETDNRISGIRVEKPSHGLVYGNVADVVGIISTNANGERFIQASSATKTGDSSVKPLGISNKQIGGSALPWQLGVLNGSGLNNIGLLVRTWGKIVEIEAVTTPALPTWFKIDDGSGVQIKCSVPTGVTINPAWNYVSVNGISSCEKVGADVIRLIRIRTMDDIVPH